jgi:hypothetical protein
MLLTNRLRPEKRKRKRREGREEGGEEFSNEGRGVERKKKALLWDWL